MRRICQLCWILLIPAVSASASELAWQQPLAEESTWSRLTYAGTLLVAGKNHLAHFDPYTGERMWQRDDLKGLAQFNVGDVIGTPFLVVNEHVSNTPVQSQIHVLDIADGTTVWDSGVVNGKALGTYPVQGRNLLLFVTSRPSDKDRKSGTYAVAVRMDSGEEVWRTRLGGMGHLPVHTSETSGFIPVQDLSGHPPPVITDDTVVLVVGDLIALDLASGAEKWRFKLKASVNNLKRTYAQPLLHDGTLYAVSRNSLHAIDLATGAERWKVKVKKATMPQLEMHGDLIVGRMGGTFSNGKDLTEAKPFGAFVVDRNAGKLNWQWSKAKDSITNLMVLQDHGLIVLADKRELHALDLNAMKKPKVVYDEKLEFKRKMGSADIAAKGIGAVGGLLGGGLAGGFKGLGGGGDRGDPALDIQRNDEQLIIRAQYHVLAHDLDSRATAWSIEFAPPGMSPMALIAMGAVTGAVAYQSASMSRSSNYGLGNPYLNSVYAISESFQDVAARRYAASEKARNVAFFLTVEEEGIVLVGIDLADGSAVGQIPMAEKEPQFMVDSIGSRVYHFKDKVELLAYDF